MPFLLCLFNFDIVRKILLTKYPLFYHVRGKNVPSLLNKRLLLPKKYILIIIKKRDEYTGSLKSLFNISFEYTLFTVKGFGSTKNHAISKFESV